MPIVDRYRKETRAAKAKANLATRRFVGIDRPIWIHEHAKTPGVERCECCESKNAHRVEEIPHIRALINRRTGERELRAQGDDPDFDALWNDPEVTEIVRCPIRCSRKQLRVIRDREHRVIGVFGGERGGKSTIEAEWFFDRILERGGRGAQFWWCSKTRKKALGVGLKKLVRGELSDRWSPGIIPEALVLSYPRGPQHEVPLLLLDGTEVWFHHASTPDGDNLKGEPPVAVVLDEGCTVDHEANWTQLKMRITDANGQVLTATTPVIGHYLQREIREKGKSYDDLDVMDVGEAALVRTVWTSLSQPENPWLNPASIKDNIETFNGDDLKIRAHIYGEWVAIGRQLWRCFDESIHLRDGPWRDVTAWGLQNITPQAAGRFFRRTESALDMIGGQDFNVDPHNLVIAQVGVPKGMDPTNRKNWIIFVLDHVQKTGTIGQFADFLTREAAEIRKLPRNYFAKLAIACDPSGAHNNPHAVHGLKGASTLAREMRARGFDCRPCHLSEKGNPQVPPRLDCISLVHKLMSDRITAPDGTVWPRIVVHGTRCPELVHSLKSQLSDERGDIAKKSTTVSDVISGPTDALRYLVWAVPGVGPEYAARKASTSFS